MLYKINRSFGYFFKKDIFRVFLQKGSFVLRNPIITEKLSDFFEKEITTFFEKDDFLLFLMEIQWIEKDETEEIFRLLQKNDIFIEVYEGYKDLLNISRQWYNPYNISYKLDYQFEDIPYYFESWLFSKETIADFRVPKNIKILLKQRKSCRTNYIKSDKDIGIDLEELLRISYWNIDYRKHTHVCSGADISTVHKTVPSAGGFYNIMLLSVSDNGNVCYFDWIKNICIATGINYWNFLRGILTKSAIWTKELDEKGGAIQFLDIATTKSVVFMYGLTDKIYKKYYNKALPFLLLEAWHISQNIALFTEVLSMWSLEIGSIIEEDISSALEQIIDHPTIPELFRTKKMLYLNTILLWYTKE